MRWLLVLVLGAGPAWADMKCETVSSWTCDRNGCDELGLPPIHATVDYQTGTMSICPSAGCREVDIFVSRDQQHISFMDDSGIWPGTFATWWPSTSELIVVEQFGAVTAIDYYGCSSPEP